MNFNDKLSSPFVLAGLFALAFFMDRLLNILSPNLQQFPAVGPSGRITSYLGWYRWLNHARDMVEEGFRKYQSRMFKVPFIDRWVVVVTSPQHIDDLRSAKDEDLSFQEAVLQIIQTPYTVGSDVHNNRYHVRVVRSSLTRNIGARFDDIQDEVSTALTEIIKGRGDEWISVPALHTVRQVISRTSNRLFVGLPLCRDPGFLELTIKHSIDIIQNAARINLWPRFLHPLVGPLYSPIKETMRIADKYLHAMIEQRLQEERTLGKDRPDRPNDLLSWLLDEAREDDMTVEGLMSRVLMINFAAIHTSSNSFTQALYHLAASPGYVTPLREEVEAVIKENGWSKASMGKMRKVDSFLRESQRFNGIHCLGMNRQVVKKGGFTFSDGTHLPQGTSVAVPTWAIHHNDENYENPYEFDGFRFATMRQDEGEGVKHQFVNTNLDYVAFGHGRHACPGRFFAANELKVMLAHVVLNYDVRCEEEGVRPSNVWFGPNQVPDPKAHVLFRKRQM